MATVSASSAQASYSWGAKGAASQKQPISFSSRATRIAVLASPP